MEPNWFRKALQAYDVWASVAFSAALGVIAMVAQLYMSLRLKAPPNAWDSSLNALFCFLPMAFLFEAFSDLKTREQIKVLEARIQRLEADKAAS